MQPGERKMDPLGFYVPPFTYSSGQLYAAAVKATGTLDNNKIGEWLHANTVDPIVGKQSFDELGNWKKRPLLMVQFPGIVDNDVEKFRGAGQAALGWDREPGGGWCVVKRQGLRPSGSGSGCPPARGTMPARARMVSMSDVYSRASTG